MTEYAPCEYEPKGLRWDVPGSQQGQTIEHAYADPAPFASPADRGSAYMRVTDWSTGATTYWRRADTPVGYECVGPVRGRCGILHDTYDAARQHCDKDYWAMKREGGYSDRRPVLDGQQSTVDGLLG